MCTQCNNMPKWQTAHCTAIEASQPARHQFEEGLLLITSTNLRSGSIDPLSSYATKPSCCFCQTVPLSPFVQVSLHPTLVHSFCCFPAHGFCCQNDQRMWCVCVLKAEGVMDLVLAFVGDLVFVAATRRLGLGHLHVLHSHCILMHLVTLQRKCIS